MTVSAIVIIAALHTGDYIYGFFLAVAILIWLAATVLYIDKKMRERRWRKRDARRGGYLDLSASTKITNISTLTRTRTWDFRRSGPGLFRQREGAARNPGGDAALGVCRTTPLGSPPSSSPRSGTAS